MKKSDILSAIIIAEINAWLTLAVFKSIGFDLKVFFGNFNLAFIFPYLDWFFCYLPLTLPPFVLFYVFFLSILGKKAKWLGQLGKYALTGSLNTLIDLAVLNLLMSIFGVAKGPYFPFFKTISFLAAVTNSYFWNKFWTFTFRETKIGIKEYGKFVSLTFVGLLFNVGIASFLVNTVGAKFGLSAKIWANLSAFTAVLIIAAWNFLSYKFLVFRKKKP
ncbi:GtrA family protein [bacterium]|nr:GtrA family protein [bacterium]